MAKYADSYTMLESVGKECIFIVPVLYCLTH